jgi:hypothetical protein
VPIERTAVVEGLGVVAITTTNVDKEILAEVRVAAAKERRTTVGVVCEALLEWLSAHGHDLPETYELVDTRP